MSTVPSRLPMKDLELGCKQLRESLERVLSDFDKVLAAATSRVEYEDALDTLHKKLDEVRLDSVHIRHGRSL